MTELKLKEGWFKLLNAKKWHYFKEDGRSLCRKWMYLGDGELEPDLQETDGEGNQTGWPPEPSPDECRTCWSKRRLQIQAEAETEAGER